MEEILLGFQLKIELMKIKQWELDRKREYLLREDIKKPLSVDKVVWPESDDKKMYSILFSDYCDGEYCAPNGLNIYSIKKQESLNRTSFYDGSILVGIAVVNDTKNRSQELKNKHSILDIPYLLNDLLEAGWSRLGYDVADYWLYSGLMNCSYSAKDKVNLAKRFANALNEYGLFNAVETAQEFCTDCETRIKEHAPFSIYGIWWKKQGDLF